MKLSYSAISTYQKCPLSYKYLYVDRLPTKPSHYLSFGNSIHSALEFFYRVEKPEPYSLEELLGELDRVWLAEGYESEALEQEYKAKGRTILSQFYDENLPSFAVPLAIEKRFYLDFDGVTLSGIIDRVDRQENGDIEIIDYKTNAKLPPKAKLNTDLQLPIYHMAAEKLYGVAPKKLTLYFLVPNEKVSTRKTKTDIAKAQATIHAVAKNISDKKFTAFRNPLCPWCDFIEICPLHVNDPVILAKAARNGKISGSKTAASATAKTPAAPAPQSVSALEELKKNATEIEKVVDDYFELVEHINTGRAKLAELRQVIHDYCETNSVTSIKGARGSLSRRAQRTVHYNVDKLRELLEPRGLWDNIIDVNSRLLKELLDDPASQDELRKLIGTAKEVEEISYVLYKKDELAEE
ncbi:MAG: PD-(D/E)XK nuclease family protein [Candidatus Aquicultor sp.]|nr:PD-(D/E)XK nuclease family protein [Candidatus Aquicultor sp.]